MASYLGQCTGWNFEESLHIAPIRKDSSTRTFNAKISGGGSAQDSKGRFRLCPSLSVYFLCLKFKLESRGTGVGYKIPTVEVLNRINDSAHDADLKGRLRPDSYGSRASSSTPTAARQTSSGLLREPDSIDNC